MMENVQSLHYEYTLEEIFSLVSVSEEWQNIVLSNGETKLIDLLDALKNPNDFISLVRSTNLISPTTFVPLDSTLWPGYTVLHMVAAIPKKAKPPETDFNDIDIVEICMNRRADIMAKNAEGMTPIHVAFYARKYDIIAMLLNYQCKLTENPSDKNLVSHFHIACAVGHRLSVQHLLSNGVNVNITDINGFTALHTLIFQTAYKDNIYEVLLSNEGLEERTTLRGHLNHLHVACYFSHFDCIKKLLEAGSDVNSRLYEQCVQPCSKRLPHYYYGFYKHVEPIFTTKPFFNYGAIDFLWREGYRKTEDLIRITFLLIEHNIDISDKQVTVVNPLECLLSQRCFRNQCYKAFYENAAIKARLNNELGILDLHLACFLVNRQLVEQLITSGINVNSKVHTDSTIWQGYTPLHCVARRVLDELYGKTVNVLFVLQLVEIVRLLTKHGALLLTTKEEDGDTPLHLINLNYGAKKLCRVSNLISVLFDLADFTVNSTNCQGISHFHIACATHIEAVIKKYLEECEFDVNQAINISCPVYPGSTALHLLVKSYHTHDLRVEKIILRSLDKMISHNANVNVQDVCGNTPLIEAVQLPSVSMRYHLCSKLISLGADVYATNVQGVTAFQMLMRTKNCPALDEIDLFLKAGCDLDMYNHVTGESCIGEALFSFNLNEPTWKNIRLREIFKNRMKTGCQNGGRSIMHDLASIDYNGRRFGVNRSHGIHRDPIVKNLTKIHEWLAKRGCDVDHQDDKGQTALHLAVKYDNWPSMMGLLNIGADINLSDKSGKTIFGYIPVSDEYKTPEQVRVVAVILARHAYHMEYCKLPVTEERKSIQFEEMYLRERGLDLVFLLFYKELNILMELKDDKNFPFSLYAFLISENTVLTYNSMTIEDRIRFDEMVAQISKEEYTIVPSILRLKYRQTYQRMALLQSASQSFNSLISRDIPEECFQYIACFLNNDDLQQMIDISN
ncbi:serine/threonine-protein phosphatase 6 regulatory ankyrin repeat subunit B-like [Phymastichus coffea]|uniref:serine/threonine-protein phosphatase 6 regulatory ankyrin repeat subunit B-like n=1 Tax=Phymastichus coffea TaxID=108790 RepID=UPI00273C5044|nr:serine/threonine-protein phosphatase 6 regulatory ankyrin repeat subunit B-like [Phymastichus coffea]